MVTAFQSNHPDNLKVTEADCELASYAYLMNLMVGFVGVPLPILNLLGSWMFLLLAETKSPFVRFHKMQALLSQIPVAVLNSAVMSWFLYSFYSPHKLDIWFWSLLGCAILANLAELVFTIRGAILVRKGRLYQSWMFGSLCARLYFTK